MCIVTILECTLPCLSVSKEKKWNLNKITLVSHIQLSFGQICICISLGLQTQVGRTFLFLTVLQSIMILCLFYFCAPLVPTLRLPPPIPNAHFLQIFFHRIQPPNIRSACSSSALLFYGTLASCKSFILAFYTNVPTTSNSLLWSPPPVTLLRNQNPSVRFSASSALNITVWNLEWDVL